MSEPRFTHVWWGDGYAVYEGDKYIGKDDQIDEVHDLMVPGGLTRVIDAEEHQDVLNYHWGDPLPVLLAALEAANA